VKVSYYRYCDPAGEEKLLAFAVNISASPVEEVTVTFEENVTRARDAERGEEVGFSFSLGRYGYRILYVR
jgi:hypothetical protein